VEQFGIGAAAGGKRFKRQSTATGLAQGRKEQAGQDGFSDSGVCASDEDDLRLQPCF